MKKLVGNLIYGQSGGPTSVINSSAYGVIKEAQKQHAYIKDIYIMKHGIEGILNDDLIKLTKEDEENIELLKSTPGSAFGSVRHKLPDYHKDDAKYVRLLYIFKKYNIRYFLYNGGNDSMDTCLKIAEYMKLIEYDIKVMGIPKTVDNDLPFTDHTPGYGSAAKFIANTIMEIYYDMLAYPQGKVTVVEIMGRHAGWLAAASALGNLGGFGPDLIYLPEIPFSIEKFKEDVKETYEQKSQCLVAVSEGVMNAEGIFISSASGVRDAFGHFQLGGVATKLAQTISNDLGIPSRSVELGSLQRAASHMQSLTDVEEAIKVGEVAVKALIDGDDKKMVIINRISNSPYQVEYGFRNLKDVANIEKKVPREMINEAGNGITQKFIDYALPLIQGENASEYQQGLQQFAKFKQFL